MLNTLNIDMRHIPPTKESKDTIQARDSDRGIRGIGYSDNSAMLELWI